MVPLELDVVPRKERIKKVEEFIWKLDMSYQEYA